MTDFVLKTPVAFIVFNRPETTAKVFAEIAKARPPMLLVVGDGPRLNLPGELERVAQTRSIIKNVNWPCEVLTNFSDINLGCRKRVSSGLDWVFELVEEAIILEDDCLPDPTFFRFCEEMLTIYRHDLRIGMISGDNFQFGRRYEQDSYYFSKFVHIWGWASWRSRWQGSYDVSLKYWPYIRDTGRLVDLVVDTDEVSYWGDIFENVYRGKINTWDYQWVFANWLEGRNAVMPNKNLVSNIGFGIGATHTLSESPLAELPLSSMTFPMVHPNAFVRKREADRYFHENFIQIPALHKFLLKFKHLVNELLSRLK